MTFVSYAQNFEDVLLWRALKHLDAGFYVDVGASHPDVASVTRAFYDRGWQGTNILATAAAADRFAAARPRDLTLVGAPEVLHAALRRHTAGAVHFLKMDALGAERGDLAGAGLDAVRPWIVLVEAVSKTDRAPTHAVWEPALLDAAYRFVWFDGLNRFYLAHERVSALSHAFVDPVNMFDDFLRAADTEWAGRIEHAQTEAAGLRNQVEQAHLSARITEERMAQLVMRVARERAIAADTELTSERERRVAAEIRGHATRATLQAELGRVHHHLAQVEQENAARKHLLAETLASTSWRVTAPLRQARQRLGAKGAATGIDIPSTGVLAAVPKPAAPDPVPPPLRTVHQFHSGSAPGDAITNAMLLTRRVLRGLGYESDIFVEHRHPDLHREVRRIDELPAHRRYVLIVRHSMGYDAIQRILDLPAPKVLIYHNITPPEHLDDRTWRHYAVLGREQLNLLRPHVTGALADSAFNALELHALGFDPVQASPLLFDVGVLRDRLQMAREPGPFTVLFVGRVTASKGQLELIEAFAHFAAGYGAPARLVLVGGHGGDRYLELVEATISRHGLDGSVIVTGTVSDAVRDHWYGQADLYVSLSQHEGFGVPLVEAMAHGVPVLAWPAGAVAATLGEAGELLDTAAPTAVGQRMLALAQDARHRAALAERGRQSLDRFELDRHVPRLIEALLRAGAAPPPDPEAREAVRSMLRYVVAGHVNGAYSLASINRGLALAIEAERPGRIRFLPIEGTPSTYLGGVPASQSAALGSLAGRAAPEHGVEVLVSQHYPVHVPARRARVQFALFFWEESAIPAETVAALERGFDAVLAPSRFVRKALIDSGLGVPVRLLGQAPDLSAFRALAERRVARAAGPFTFLHVSSCFPRKGVDLLLAAWAAAFRPADPVRLVIKGFPNPHNDVAEQLARHPRTDMAPITLIDAELDEAALLGLYETADAMVLPTRGEGYNLPAQEAMAAGLPLVVTGFGGHLDFCGPGEARLIDYSFTRSTSHLASPSSVWAEPSREDLTAALREMLDDPAAVASRAARARERVAHATGRAAMVGRLEEAALDALSAVPPAMVRVAWVSTWGVRCGVAEYSRHLLDNLPRDGLELVILADQRTPEADEPRVRSPWRINEANSFAPLMSAILREDAQVVVIQHQPGLWSWDKLATLLLDLAAASRLAVVILHNTRDLLDAGETIRTETIGALGSASRVLVHTLDDLNRLKRWGLVSNVALLPHGAILPRPSRRAQELVPSDAPLIGSTGFFLPDKGLPQLIEALALLRQDWPLARLRLVNAAYDDPISLREIAECRALVARLGVADAVEFITDFLPHGRCLDLLGECDLLALTYQSSLEASSASLRTAFAAGVAVAVTPLPLFQEEGASPLPLAGFTPADIARGLSRMLSDRALRWEVAETAHYWMLARGWPETGRRVAGMLRGLVASREKP